jgi:hypothetical protein
MTVATAAIIGIGTAAVSAGVGMYSANQAKKSAQGAAGAAQKQFLSTGRKADSLLAKYERLLSDPARVLALTMNANNQNRQGAFDQATRINNYNTDALHKGINKSLPGYQSAINAALRNTRSWIKGRLPEDVASYVEDRAAEKATRFGMPIGSGNARALTARDLGRTSLDLMEKGENSLQRWISTAKNYLTPALANPMDFLFTPTQYTNTVLAGANVASQRAGIITGAGNAATGAYLQGAEAGIKADQAQAQALQQGLESIGGIGMSYAGRGATTGGMRPAVGGAGTGTAGGNSLAGMFAALGIGGQGVSTASPTTYQSYLNN